MCRMHECSEAHGCARAAFCLLFFGDAKKSESPAGETLLKTKLIYRKIMQNQNEQNLPPDYKVRQAAIDPTKSFAVAAPAGSGKTGLLTQRVLQLLASCEQPEEVIAITVTRKAAGEIIEPVSAAPADETTENQDSGETTAAATAAEEAKEPKQKEEA